MEMRNPYIFDPNRVEKPNTFHLRLIVHNLKHYLRLPLVHELKRNRKSNIQRTRNINLDKKRGGYHE